MEYNNVGLFNMIWWTYFFSENPASPDQQVAGLYYDKNGVLHYPNEYVVRSSSNDCCSALHGCPDCHGCYCFDASGICSCDSEIGGIFAIILFIVLFIVSIALVSQYPPIMLSVWIILSIGSFSEIIAGKSSYCFNLRVYSGISIGLSFMIILYIFIEVFKLRQIYNKKLPGTPGVVIDVNRLIGVCVRAFYILLGLGICSIAASVGGLILLIKCYGGRDNYNMCITYSECQWTTTTCWVWVMVHFLNVVFCCSMMKRMYYKKKILISPPSYVNIGNDENADDSNFYMPVEMHNPESKEKHSPLLEPEAGPSSSPQRNDLPPYE